MMNVTQKFDAVKAGVKEKELEASRPIVDPMHLTAEAQRANETAVKRINEVWRKFLGHDLKAD